MEANSQDMAKKDFAIYTWEDMNELALFEERFYARNPAGLFVNFSLTGNGRRNG